MPSLIHAERTDGPFLGRRLPIKAHPFHMESETILQPMLNDDCDEGPPRKAAPNDKRQEGKRIRQDVNGADPRAFAFSLHPMVLKWEIPEGVSSD